MSLLCPNSLLFSKLNIYRNLSKIFQNTLKTKFVEIFKRIFFFIGMSPLQHGRKRKSNFVSTLNLIKSETELVFLCHTNKCIHKVVLDKKWYNIDSSSYWYVVDGIKISMHWLVQYLIELFPFWRFPCNLWKSFRFWINWFFGVRSIERRFRHIMKLQIIVWLYFCVHFIYKLNFPPWKMMNDLKSLKEIHQFKETPTVVFYKRIWK